MSIKITPDKYPQIIEVYNTEGKTAAYDLMRSCYEIKNPTCVMKRMKADKSLGYNYDTDRFESDSRKEDDIFLNLEMLCENKIETSDRSEGAINRNDRIKAMENMVHSLISDRLLELSKYVLLDPIGKRILIDKSSMGGCDMPVVINSGSGNQGIACSVPLIVYAREMELPDYVLYRALVFSNLLTVYQKQYIGKLSAFCGAVSASCAAGAGITYMGGGELSVIKKTIENTLANIPGIICDGAKISCAAKIAASLDAAFLAHHLAMNGQSYAPYTGILKEEAGETISCVGQIGKEGMKETDKEILRIMLERV